MNRNCLLVVAIGIILFVCLDVRPAIGKRGGGRSGGRGRSSGRSGGGGGFFSGSRGSSGARLGGGSSSSGSSGGWSSPSNRGSVGSGGSSSYGSGGRKNGGGGFGSLFGNRATNRGVGGGNSYGGGTGRWNTPRRGNTGLGGYRSSGRGGGGGFGRGGLGAAGAGLGMGAGAGRGLLGSSSRSSAFKNMIVGAAAGHLAYQAGKHIIRNMASPMMYNNRPYYWGSSYYQPRAGYPTVCRMPISPNDPVLGNVYTSSGGGRPKEIVWDCHPSEVCCESDCCPRGYGGAGGGGYMGSGGGYAGASPVAGAGGYYDGGVSSMTGDTGQTAAAAADYPQSAPSEVDSAAIYEQGHQQQHDDEYAQQRVA